MAGPNSGSMLKLAILGDGGVGKTALVIQLCLNKFVETYDPTIEDSYRKRVLLDEHAMTLELMDTAGQEEYLALQDLWIRDGEGFLLVYSVTQRLSFTRIKQYYDEILRMKDGEHFGAVLVGNKIDQAGERQVSTREGELLAESWGIPFFETSAKMNINTEVAFLTLARLTRDNRWLEDQQLPAESPAAAAAAAASSSLPPAQAVTSPQAGTPAAVPEKASPPVASLQSGQKPVPNVPPPSYLAGAREPAVPNTSSATTTTNENPDQTEQARKNKSMKKRKKGKCILM